MFITLFCSHLYYYKGKTSTFAAILEQPLEVHMTIMRKPSIFIALFVLFLAAPSNLLGESKSSKDEGYDPVGTVMHHIGNANEFHLQLPFNLVDVYLPLPVIVWSKDHGVKAFMSSKFKKTPFAHHGHYAYNGYVLDHGQVKRIKGSQWGSGKQEMHVGHDDTGKGYVEHGGSKKGLEDRSTLMGSMLGGGMTSWIDFSISKIVFTLLLVALLLIFVWNAVARGYKKNNGKSPSGIQSFLEPLFVFLRDEVCKPMIGPKYERYMPFIMTVFFFILLLNLLGLVPFFPGSANVTGNIAVTLVLAVITFLITTFSGNKHYWAHIFWMPGTPVAIRPFLAIIEFIGIFTKPFSLMVRLFANITAGHIIILSLVGLIFVLGNAGQNIGGAIGGAAVAVPFTIFMNLIEILVAFLQAYIFAILSASYIGGAIEEHHDH